MLRIHLLQQWYALSDPAMKEALCDTPVMRQFTQLGEHPFRVIKRQFGYTKVRYRDLAKNTAQMFTLFALSNLWMVRRQFLPQMG